MAKPTLRTPSPLIPSFTPPTFAASYPWTATLPQPPLSKSSCLPPLFSPLSVVVWYGKNQGMHRAHCHTSVILIINLLPVIAATVVVEFPRSPLVTAGYDSPCCSLGFNNITDVGAQAIALALKENKTLTSLKYDKYHVNIKGCGGCE